MALANNKKIPSDTLVHIFFLISLVALTVSFLFLLGEVKKVRDSKIDAQDETKTVIQPPAPSQTSIPAPVKVVAATPLAKRTTYLNLNGTFTTKNTDWVDIGGTDTPINLETEYGKDSYVDWDASINTSSSGSKVFIRLYDATHSIAVNGSDLESNSTTSVRVSSGRLYFWRGQNIYRVQIKSLNGADATFNGGRIKIVY